MSTSEFGSSVEEVRAKLNHMLPLVRDGRDTIEKLISYMTDGDWAPYHIDNQADFLRVEHDTVAEGIDKAIEALDPDVDNLFKAGKTQLDEHAKDANEVVSKLQSAQEVIDSEFKPREVAVTDAAGTLESTVSAALTTTGAQKTRMDNAKSDFNAARAGVIEKMNADIDRHSQWQQQLEAKLNDFESQKQKPLEESLSAELGQFSTSMESLKGEADKGVKQMKTEMDEMLDVLRLDRLALKDGFCEQYKTILGGIAAPIVDAAQVAVDQLESCRDQALENLESEVKETQEAVEDAKAAVDDVAPQLAGVDEAQRTADKMNHAL